MPEILGASGGNLLSMTRELRKRYPRTLTDAEQAEFLFGETASLALLTTSQEPEPERVFGAQDLIMEEWDG